MKKKLKNFVSIKFISPLCSPNCTYIFFSFFSCVLFSFNFLKSIISNWVYMFNYSYLILLSLLVLRLMLNHFTRILGKFSGNPTNFSLFSVWEGKCYTVILFDSTIQLHNLKHPTNERNERKRERNHFLHILYSPNTIVP